MKTIKTLLILVLFLIIRRVNAQKNDPVYWTRTNNHVETQKISPGMKTQLGTVVQTAAQLSNAFVTEDETGIRKLSRKIKDELAAVIPTVYYGKDYTAWTYSKNWMEYQVNKLIAGDDTRGQLVAFASFNESLFNSVKTFGVKDQVIFYHFCSRALNQKGAYWFSNTLEVKNPYLEEKKISCVVTKMIL